MKQPYLTVPFSFSDEALNELNAIVDPLYDEFITSGVLGGNQVQLTSRDGWQDLFHESLPGRELQSIIDQYKLNRPTYQLFMYRPVDGQTGELGNPHLDSLTPEIFCPFRFNILLEGDPSHEMVWWDLDASSNLIEFVTFEHVDGRKSWRWQVAGNTIKERLDKIGTYTWRSGNLSIPQKTASFLRTNKVHAIEMHGKKRIVLSLRFDKSWENIENEIESNPHVLTRYGQNFGGATPPVVAPSNDTIDMILQHRSVRRFTDQQPPFGTVELLVAAAQSSSTSGMTQLWSVVSVDDMAIRKLLMRDSLNAPSQKEAPIFLVFCSDLTRVAEVYGEEHAEALKHAEFTFLSIVDASMAAQTVMIAAESMGMGGVYHGSVRIEPHIAITALGLPKHVFPLFGMCIGYPSDATDTIQPAAIRPKLSQRWILHRNRYNRPDVSEIERHNSVVTRWLATFGKNLPNWSGTLLRRKDNIDKGLAKLMEKAGLFFK